MAVFTKSFMQFQPLWHENTFGLEVFKHLFLTLGASAVALVFWVIRRPSRVMSFFHPLYYLLVVTSCYTPSLVTLAHNWLRARGGKP